MAATASAEIAVDPDGGGVAGVARGGGYSGPLAYRQGKPMRPDVAAAFDRMAAAARKEAGLLLLVTSGYRSDAEQARLPATQPAPHLFSLCRAAFLAWLGVACASRHAPHAEPGAKQSSGHPHPGAFASSAAPVA